MSNKLDQDFIDSLAKIGEPASPRFKWYLTAIVGLGALNYPEYIPSLYKYLLEKYIPLAEQKTETRKILEGLTKVCGIHGAAKTGNSTRALATAIPEHLKDSQCYRENETFENAEARGRAMVRSIYGPNTGYDGSKTKNAAPDYSWIVTKLFYGYIFSFDEILDILETEQVVIASLIGIDCQEQMTNHMIGMMFNGAKREEVEALKQVVLALAERLDVKFKNPDIQVPEMPPSKI